MTFPAALALLSAAAATSPAHGQSVSLSGSFGDKALLVIDGTPRSVAVGSTTQGVRLVSVDSSQAVVEIKGQRVALAIGGTQVNIGGAPSEGNARKIVLTADGAGHFFTGGSINGNAVRFLVDTGATRVALGQAEADRLGVDYRKGTRSFSSTANGNVPSYHATIATIRVGDVTVYNVEATVLPAQMTHVLLGNSYLTRFQMDRENDRLTLERRF